jgi:hypothetical protein
MVIFYFKASDCRDEARSADRRIRKGRTHWTQHPATGRVFNFFPQGSGIQFSRSFTTIIRLQKLKLHRQHCMYVEGYNIFLCSRGNYFCFQSALGYSWRCKIFTVLSRVF